jgi:hypothetical protein
MLFFPSMVAPASSNRVTMVASTAGTYPCITSEPFVSSIPATLTLSLSPTLRPASGPLSAPSIVHLVIQALCGSSSSSGS